MKVVLCMKMPYSLCRVASFPSVASPVYPKIALLPNDYYHLVTCTEVVTISDNQCAYNIAHHSLVSCYSTSVVSPTAGQLRVGAGPVARGDRGAHGKDLHRLRPLHEEGVIIRQVLRS